ncbi:MAG: hypothetical protein IMY76_09520 [Chloroflexi bacterium]|nr:hypothetical protein [Chloroflexota bacterium]
MKARGLITVFIIFVFTLTAACSGQATPVATVLKVTTPPTSMPVETAGPSCLGNIVSPIGKAIANEYESADYDQVMTWFCNGADFDDILVALETELQTETSADEMLQMLADGFSWEDIWLITGLTD